MVWSLPSGSSGRSLSQDPWGLGSDSGSDATLAWGQRQDPEVSCPCSLGDDIDHGDRVGHASLQPSPAAAETSGPLPPQAAACEADNGEPLECSCTRDRSRSRSRTPTEATRSDIPRADRGQQLSALRRLPKPAFLPGTEWWSGPLWHAVEGLAAKMPAQPTRAMTVESFCAGMATEAFGFKARRVYSNLGVSSLARFQLPALTAGHFRSVWPYCVEPQDRFMLHFPRQALQMNIKLTAASDRKPAACKFIHQNHDYQHIFTDADAHIAGSGECFLHSKCGRKRNCTLTAAERQVDLVVAGIPCHPFTHMRQRSASSSSARKGVPSEHPDFDTVFRMFPAFLKERRPGGFVVEETESFLEPHPGTGQRFVDSFIQACSAHGYAMVAMQGKAGIWLEWPRDRFSAMGSLGTHSSQMFCRGRSQELAHAWPGSLAE